VFNGGNNHVVQGGRGKVTLNSLYEFRVRKLHFKTCFDPLGVFFRLVFEIFLEVYRSYSEGKSHCLQFLLPSSFYV
jgi:hypothetical protein